MILIYQCNSIAKIYIAKVFKNAILLHNNNLLNDVILFKDLK